MQPLCSVCIIEIYASWTIMRRTRNARFRADHSTTPQFLANYATDYFVLK